MAVPPVSISNSTPKFDDPILNRLFLSPAEKMEKENGRKIVKAFYSAQTSNSSSLNFFKLRNARWIELLLWAKGSQKMAEFLGFMNVSDANKAWLNIDMEQSRIASQFVGTLVESMAKNRVYPCVSAVDDGSISEKEERLFDALYRMHEVQTIHQVQQAMGQQVEPPTAYVPDNEMSARLYFELEDRLPKEIRFEKMLAKVQSDINFEKVANRKTLFDITVCNFGATKIEKLGPLQYTVRKCVTTNMVYNFFINDTGELEVTEIGEFVNIKVKDFRKKFLKTADNPGGLDEADIFDLAKKSAHVSLGVFNYMWSDSWAQNTTYLSLPYDDSSIMVLDCEINCGEDVYYVETKGPHWKANIQPKKGIPYQQTTKKGEVINQAKPDNVDVIKRQKNTWMRGIYAPYGDVMCYWGAPDIIISSYTDVANPLSSYSVVIPNNDGEYTPSLFERIMEPLREYQFTKLQRKKIISQVRSTGIRIDVENARNLDLGNGNSIAWEEVLRIYQNTGVELYSSKGLDPLQREGPALGNTVHDESIEKIIGLTNVMLGIANEIRQLIGVPPSRDGSPLPSRTPAELAENQNQSSYNVTDFVLDYNMQLWEDTFKKLCLLHWNDIVKTEPESKDDILNTRFDVSTKMKISEYEKQITEADIQRFSQMPDENGMPLLSPKDAIMIREIDDYKLRCIYLDETLKKNRQAASDQAAKIQKDQLDHTQLAGQQAAQQAQQLEQQKQQGVDAKNRDEKELALINGILAMQDTAITKGTDIPQEWKPVVAAMISNIMMPVLAKNQQMQQALQQAQQPPQQGQPQQGPPQPQDPSQQQMPPQGQPQQNVPQ